MSHIDEGRLAAYLDGELPAGSGELVEIELHVEACTECRKLLEESLKHRNRARSILRSGTPSAVEAPPFEEILRRAGKTGASAGIARERSRLASLAWAATIVLAIGAGWYVTRDRDGGPLAEFRRSNRMEQASAESTVALAKESKDEQLADARRELPAPTVPTAPPIAAASPIATPPAAGARADEPALVAAAPTANQAPPAVALQEKKQDDTAAAAKAAPQLAGAMPSSRDSTKNEMAKTLALDAVVVTGQASGSAKRAAESVSALRDTPNAARGRAATPAPSVASAPTAAASAPAPWRETSQGGAMRQIGRLPLQVPDLPVLAYYVRPSGAAEVRVTQDLGQGQVLEIIQTKLSADSAVSPESRSEVAGFAPEVTTVSEGFRTTVRGPVARDSLTALLGRLR